MGFNHLKIVASWDLIMKNCDFVGFNNEKLWFHGIYPWKIVVSWDLTMGNGDFMEI